MNEHPSSKPMIVNDMSRFVIVELPEPATHDERKRIAQRIAAALELTILRSSLADELDEMREELAADLKPGVELLDRAVTFLRSAEQPTQRHVHAGHCTVAYGRQCSCGAAEQPLPAEAREIIFGYDKLSWSQVMRLRELLRPAVTREPAL